MHIVSDNLSLTRDPRMLGWGVVDQELPSDAPDQRRGTGDIEYGSPADRVREHSGQGEDDDGAEGCSRKVDRHEDGALVLRRPKRPVMQKKSNQYSDNM